MNDALVQIEINGRPYQARKGAMVIEVADEAGIAIPRFCYHKKLSVAANCRMCLVEVEKAPKPLPACATPVADGMRVHTRSTLAVRAQRSVMEFLLINHPLDCPICDQGGECELQDVAMGYGRDVSRFTERKRVVADKNIGPLIATDMTRCIHCTRCVRFGEEIGGMPELGATGRGEHMEIGTYIERAVASEMSGNVIDLCPVGALTSKPFRYRARSWEMQQREGIAPHDAVGSNIYMHVRGNRVMRVVPRENEAVNEVWISDRDRFSYEGIYSEDRLLEPMVKRDGEWRSTDWDTALEFAAEGVKRVRDERGAEGLGALLSPSAPLEELYLSQALMRGLGTRNVDHRLRETDVADDAQAPPFPWLGMSLAELETLDAVLVIGGYPRKEHPIVNHRLRKASLRGCDVMMLEPLTGEHNLRTAQTLRAGPLEFEGALAGIAAACAGAPGLEDITPSNAQRDIAERLREAGRAAVLVGPFVHAHPRASALRALAAHVARASGASYGTLGAGANATGAWIAGAVPHRGPGGKAEASPGLAAARMIEEGLAGYVLLGIEPELDCADGARALEALGAADFVVSLTAYRTPTMEWYADVLLPVSAFAETPGTYVNMEGRWQSVEAAVAPLGESRPAWRVLRVLGNRVEVPGFDYQSAAEVLDAVRRAGGDLEPAPPGERAVDKPASAAPGEGTAYRIGTVPIYAVDPLVRRAKPLQETADGRFGGVRVNAALAATLRVAAGDTALVAANGTKLRLPVVLDERVPDGCAALAAGVPETVGFGADFAPLAIEKA